ncbi:hypothetical protein L484_024337 [Morus notabilis]|uniref:Uncharacterized protein n=1 Tax=Morus notabilis TaxID=981085 RepID=W9S7L8_9ROSA|nr:hypothetical protein L484_024337 [Morus notabilis]
MPSARAPENAHFKDFDLKSAKKDFVDFVCLSVEQRGNLVVFSGCFRIAERKVVGKFSRNRRFSPQDPSPKTTEDVGIQASSIRLRVEFEKQTLYPFYAALRSFAPQTGLLESSTQRKRNSGPIL